MSTQKRSCMSGLMRCPRSVSGISLSIILKCWFFSTIQLVSCRGISLSKPGIVHAFVTSRNSTHRTFLASFNNRTWWRASKKYCLGSPTFYAEKLRRITYLLVLSLRSQLRSRNILRMDIATIWQNQPRHWTRTYRKRHPRKLYVLFPSTIWQFGSAIYSSVLQVQSGFSHRIDSEPCEGLPSLLPESFKSTGGQSDDILSRPIFNVEKENQETDMKVNVSINPENPPDTAFPSAIHDLAIPGTFRIRSGSWWV